mgnify:CR=1 FL=1|jgi:hypothetical protein
MTGIEDFMSRRLDEIEAHAKALGRMELLEELKEIESIRESMLGPKWAVIYTENGAKDILWSKLKGEQ